jgi:hypothetical protein
MLEGKNPEPLYLNVNPDAQFWLREDSYFSTRLLTSRSEGGTSLVVTNIVQCTGSKRFLLPSSLTEHVTVLPQFSGHNKCT